MGEHKYALRLPEELWRSVSIAASLNRRSVNSEIVWRLSQPIPQAVARGVSQDLAERNGFEVPSLRPPETKPPKSRSFRPDFKGGKR